MNILAIISAIILVIITAYWLLSQHLHGPLYIVAFVLSLVILLGLLVPYAPARAQP